MGTSVNISYLALDVNNDPDFNASSSLTGIDAIAQAILTRLNLFLGEWHSESASE